MAGCSLGGNRGAFSASSFKGTVDEPRRDNDANHERGRGGAGGAGGVGVDIGPGVSGVAFVFVSMSVGSGSEAGGSTASCVGEGGEDGCARSGCGSSGIRQSELRNWMANTAKTCRTERANPAYIWKMNRKRCLPLRSATGGPVSAFTGDSGSACGRSFRPSYKLGSNGTHLEQRYCRSSPH